VAGVKDSPELKDGMRGSDFTQCADGREVRYVAKLLDALSKRKKRAARSSQ
jgi:hypothetical protein